MRSTSPARCLHTHQQLPEMDFSHYQLNRKTSYELFNAHTISILIINSIRIFNWINKRIPIHCFGWIEMSHYSTQLFSQEKRDRKRKKEVIFFLSFFSAVSRSITNTKLRQSIDTIRQSLPGVRHKNWVPSLNTGEKKFIVKTKFLSLYRLHSTTKKQNNGSNWETSLKLSVAILVYMSHHQWKRTQEVDLFKAD